MYICLSGQFLTKLSPPAQQLLAIFTHTMLESPKCFPHPPTLSKMPGQKFKYPHNEKSFYDVVKNVFIIFKTNCFERRDFMFIIANYV